MGSKFEGQILNRPQSYTDLLRRPIGRHPTVAAVAVKRGLFHDFRVSGETAPIDYRLYRDHRSISSRAISEEHVEVVRESVDLPPSITPAYVLVESIFSFLPFVFLVFPTASVAVLVNGFLSESIYSAVVGAFSLICSAVLGLTSKSVYAALRDKNSEARYSGVERKSKIA